MRKNWTEAEITFMKENVGIVKLSTIARQLERTEQALLSKMKRIGISNTKAQTGYLTTCELAKVLKVDPATVRGWISRHGLSCTKKATRMTKKFYLIHPEDFWKWAEVNRKKLDFSKIEYQSIIPEPSWVALERKKEKPVNYKAWSVKEEKKLLMMFSEGYSAKEVAGRLNRSIVSVQRKYGRLEGCSR
ncbi:helix-turn-helix domain-containing protein [Peribacillus glennii]|uniref:Helix-turn-helix domain-containing protein n=1 Tax=Peribacillus glennii TaxID=2303991 RepID=A0A372LJF0_9BACI|nr:helix-turn-helix domain-containing protein [Peribacillus glennii]RFU66578.1 helix-turn-helix domain-containing protein [Peribacillus glennii]